MKVNLVELVSILSEIVELSTTVSCSDAVNETMQNALEYRYEDLEKIVPSFSLSCPHPTKPGWDVCEASEEEQDKWQTETDLAKTSIPSLLALVFKRAGWKEEQDLLS